MNCYFGGMRYRRSYTKCPYFMRSGKVLSLFYLRILITPLVSSNSSFRLVEHIDNRIKFVKGDVDVLYFYMDTMGCIML